jgi:hypothetical protein
MINITTNVGQGVGIVFSDTTGITTFPTLTLFTDNNTNPLTPNTIMSLGTTGLTTPVETNIGTGIYSLIFSPTSVGNYYITYKGIVTVHVTVAAQDLLAVLKNVEDEALGSWSWDKAAGTLTLLRQTGTTMATYSVTDTITLSNRNRLT